MIVNADMTEKELIKQMIEHWREQFTDVREQLILKGAEANSLEYNLLSTEALRLSLCINDATDVLLSIAESEN